MLVGAQNVIEAHNLTYAIGLSRAPTSNVSILINATSEDDLYVCKVSQSRIQFLPTEDFTTTKPVNIETFGNLIDEGTNTIL